METVDQINAKVQRHINDMIEQGITTFIEQWKKMHPDSREASLLTAVAQMKNEIARLQTTTIERNDYLKALIEIAGDPLEPYQLHEQPHRFTAFEVINKYKVGL